MRCEASVIDDGYAIREQEIETDHKEKESGDLQDALHASRETRLAGQQAMRRAVDLQTNET